MNLLDIHHDETSTFERKKILKETFPDLAIDEALVDAFVKNAHHLKLIRGRKFGEFDKQQAELRTYLLRLTCHLVNQRLFFMP